MKSLLIVLLVVGLFLALFLTRPTKADFETYIHGKDIKITDGKASGGKTISSTIGDKLKTFTAEQVQQSAADLYLSQCEYENRVVWTNVKKDGKVVYTGAVGHWFERGG